jgi:hypothetical protein
LMDGRHVTVNGRAYRWPARPVVVVCLDGSAVEYIDRAVSAGQVEAVRRPVMNEVDVPVCVPARRSQLRSPPAGGPQRR